MIQVTVAFVFGLVFVITLIVLAIKFPKPTPFQYTIFRSVLALAAAGIAAMVPGFLTINLSETNKFLISAGGALGVFVIVFFFNPARLRHPHAEEIDELPEPPQQLRDGSALDSDGRKAFEKTWQALTTLEKAAEDLWNEVNISTISKFYGKRDLAAECINNHALFFSEADYNSLQNILSAAGEYWAGKLTLFELQQQVASHALGPDDEAVEKQTLKNKRWLTRYKQLLASIRSSFRDNIQLTAKS
jgi:hypothetical protein